MNFQRAPMNFSAIKKYKTLIVSLVLIVSLILIVIAVIILINFAVNTDPPSSQPVNQPGLDNPTVKIERSFSFFKICDGRSNEFVKFYEDVNQVVVDALEKELHGLKTDPNRQRFSSSPVLKHQLTDLVILNAFSQTYYTHDPPLIKIEKTYRNNSFRKTHEIRMDDVEITEMPYDAISFFDQIENFYLIFCEITEINRPLSSFLPAGVEEIAFHSCKLPKLPKLGDVLKNLKSFSFSTIGNLVFDDADLPDLANIEHITFYRKNLNDDQITKLQNIYGERLKLL